MKGWKLGTEIGFRSWEQKFWVQKLDTEVEYRSWERSWIQKLGTEVEYRKWVQKMGEEVRYTSWVQKLPPKSSQKLPWKKPQIHMSKSSKNKENNSSAQIK